MPAYQSSLTLAADIQNITQVEGEVESLLEKGLISEELFGNVIVVATEASLNAIHHGSNDNPNKTVNVEFNIDDKELVMTVSDQGEGFDYENLPDPTNPENLERLSGRGIFIINNLVDELEFQNQGATLKMTFNLNISETVEA